MLPPAAAGGAATAIAFGAGLTEKSPALATPCCFTTATQADSFCNVYIDESSQTKARYLVIGGLVVPLSHAELFEADMVACRRDTLPATRSDGTPQAMKWEKVHKSTYSAYQTFIDAAFDFRRLRNLPAGKGMGVHCLVVDTSQRPLRRTGLGDKEIGFDIEFHFLCTVPIPKIYRGELFHLYPHRRHACRELREMRKEIRETRRMMNLALVKWNDKREFPIRDMQFQDVWQWQALQITDILIGALAYRCNGLYEKPDASPGKKQLCDHIWKRFKLGDPLNTTPFQAKRFMTWIHRPTPPNAPKSGPQHW
jgi:hypothetical protein